MGCDHLICRKCKIGYDLESGTAFWLPHFLKDHWHQNPKLKGSYFEIAFADFPNHLFVRHRIPIGYISVRTCSHFCKQGKGWVFGLCFHKRHILRTIKQINLAKRKGKWKKRGYEEDPFIVRKTNKEHDWLRAY